MWKSRGFLALIASAVACAAGTNSSRPVLQSPAQNRCEEAGLRGCPDFADGVVAFVDGDRPTAMHKITAASNQNSPDQLRELAERLASLPDLPGAHDYRARVNELAAILVAQSLATNAAVAQAPALAPSSAPLPGPTAAPAADAAELAEATRVRDRMLLTLTARSDPERFTTETVLAPAIGKPCEPGGATGVCSARRGGPLVVTDVVATAGCPDRLLVGAGVKDTSILKWWVDARTPGIHGANLIVAPNEVVQVVQLQSGKQLSTDQRCAVTWSGYEPRRMPEPEPK